MLNLCAADKNKDTETGNIVFDYEGAIQHISYSIKEVLDLKGAPRYGDKVLYLKFHRILRI